MEFQKFKVETMWWQTYRRIKNRPRRQLSLEMIVRRSFGDVLREYLRHCSLVGIKQLCEERGISRIVWSILIGATYGAVVYMLMNVYADTLSKPLIVTMDSSTLPIREIDFPAVAVCNINRISRKAVKEMARDVYAELKQSSPLKNIEWYLLQGGRLLDYSYNESLRLRLLALDPHLSEQGEDIIDDMQRLAPNCEEMLLRCSWAGKVVNCSDIFAVRRTVLGHCCAFNYVLEYNTMGASRPETTGLIRSARRQEQAGSKHGLIVVLEPFLKDYAYPLRSMQGFEILLFDPTHFADPSGGRVVHRIAEPSEVTVMELSSVKQIATGEVRKYPLSVRRCLFRDEIPEHFGNMYSYSACIARCRIKTIRSLCKCTPYFLPTDRRKTATCSLLDLLCLNKYKEKLLYMYPFYASTNEGLEMELLDSLHCPKCLPDCELTKHSTRSSVIPLRGLNGNIMLPSLMTGLNLSEPNNISMVYIYQPTNDAVLDRLDVVSYWYEILSNIGGFAGILVGFSIISVFEFIYFFIVRFIQVFCKNCKMYY